VSTRTIALIGLLGVATLNLLGSLGALKRHECWNESDGWTDDCYAKAQSLKDSSASYAAIDVCGAAAQRYIAQCANGTFSPFVRHARREPLPTN
jgi:hypothetical protein